MERGFYHPTRGYWQTTGTVPEAILSSYPEGTVEVPLKPGQGWEFNGTAWTAPQEQEDTALRPLNRLDFWLAAAEVGVTIEGVRARVASVTDPIERSRSTAFVEFAEVYRRDDPLLIAMAEAEGITSSQLDALWIWAQG